MTDQSKLYGHAQTILICIYGAVLLFAPGRRIAGGRALGIVGEVLALLGAALVLVAVAQMGKTITCIRSPRPALRW